MCITIENRSGQFTKSSIKNDELRNYANQLQDDAMNIRANLLHMSAIMAAISNRADAQKAADEVTILAEFGDSITQFGEERLGLKKSQVYSMVAVGTTFLDSDGKPMLKQTGGKWSNTQLMALLPLAGTGKKKLPPTETLKAAQRLANKGTIKPSMTVKALKAVVAENRPDAAERAAKAEKDEQAKAEQAEQMEKAEKAIEEKHDTIRGELVGEIRFYLVDNNLHAIFNGEESQFAESNIEAIVTMLHKCVNFSNC